METHEQAVKRGKKSKKSGADFERRVRADLEEKGWIVAKWTNNVELVCTKSEPLGDTGFVRGTGFTGKLTPAKHKFRGPGIPMAMGTGFPDFIAFKNHTEQSDCGGPCFDVIGVEVKSNGYLKPEEKEKCKWLIQNRIFDKILIAKKTKIKNRIKIIYEDFKEKSKT